MGEVTLPAFVTHHLEGIRALADQPYEAVAKDFLKAKGRAAAMVECEKAVAFEAIRSRLPDVWTLLDIVESANPPDYHDDPNYPGDPAWHDIPFAARGGWQVTIFYDGGDLDYVAEIRSPDGLVIDPWDWPMGAPGGNALRNWRNVGDRARLMALNQRDPIRIIDCTDLAPDAERPVDEAERDRISYGGIEILGGYLDWDASVIRRIPAPVKEAA